MLTELLTDRAEPGNTAVRMCACVCMCVCFRGMYSMMESCGFRLSREITVLVCVGFCACVCLSVCVCVCVFVCV